MTHKRAGGTIAEGENIVVHAGLQARAHHQLVDAVRFQPIELAQERRRLDAGRPYLECRLDQRAVGRPDAFGGDLCGPCASDDVDAQPVERRARLAADALAEAGQYPRRAVENRDTDVFGLDRA